MANYLFTDKEFTSMGLKVSAIDPASLVHDEADAIGGGNAYPKENDVLIIDIFLKFKDAEYQHYQDLGGIALLKFLRILGSESSRKHRNHIVLLSPWSLPQLLRMEPGYHILASPGITIAQYTYCVDELKGHDGVKLDLKELATEKAPPKEKLRDWFKAGISLPKDERHNWANWWGLFSMVLEHNDYEGRESLSLPQPLVVELKRLQNQEACLVYTPYRARPEIENYPRLSRACEILYVDDQANDGWTEVLQEVLRFTDGPSANVRPVAPPPGSFIKPESCEAYYDAHLRPHVLRDGDASACHMIMLDVRLDRNRDAVETGPPEELSGIRLLKHLRHKHPGIPILALTASKRPDVHRALFEQGADRIHPKAAIDQGLEQFSTGDTGISSLVNKVNLLSGSTYKILNDLGDFYQRLRDGDPFWWQSYAFTSGDAYDTCNSFRDRNALPTFVEAIGGALEEYRYVLREHEQVGSGINIRFGFRASNLINRLGGLVEFIHTGGQGTRDIGRVVYDTYTPERSRQDILGWFLLQCRNQASHYSPSRYTGPKRLNGFIRKLLAYLDQGTYRACAHDAQLDVIRRTVGNQKWWFVPPRELPTIDPVVRPLIQGRDLVDHMFRYT